MHLLKTHLCLLLCIGMFSLGVKADEPTDEKMEELAKKHMVYVEPSAKVAIHPDTEDSPMALYKDRRGSWGVLVGVGYSSYQPNQYQPSFSDGGYGDNYGSPSMPMLEIHIQPKKNLNFGSIGLDIGAGSFSAGSGDGATLSLTEIQLGLVYNADTLFTQPYLVPYIEAGAYTILYNESQTGEDTSSGNSSISPFFAVGVNLQLDWLDRESSAETYKETALKSLYVYLEERMYSASNSGSDPNFSGTFWNAGLRAEF